jgi:GrpB-like predicted nucleotidyltransferase (UPF0157 family)
MSEIINPSLGVPRGTTVVRDYDERWAEEFQREARALRDLLGDLPSGIEHVGSTAVPGLPAKPLIDVALAFTNRERLDEARRRLQGAGYDDRGDWDGEGGVIFAKGPESARTHLLHLVEATDEQWNRYLAFRDTLRRDDERRRQYAALKNELAARFPSDRRSYVSGKKHFIEEVLRSN